MTAAPPRFRTQPSVDPGSLSFEPFSRVAEIERFTCGDPDLDDFIRTEEVEQYNVMGYGKTTLVWMEHELVGYYAVGPGEVDAEILKVGQRGFHTKRSFIENSIPAIKIGRLAVERRFQKKGIGRTLVAKILDDAIHGEYIPPIVAVRATPRSIEFYLKCGFRPFSAKPKKATSGSLSLFFRLDVLNPVDVRADVAL